MRKLCLPLLSQKTAGIEKHVLLLASELSKKNIQVLLLCRSDAHFEVKAHPNLRLVTIPTHRASQVTILSRFFKALYCDDSDVLHVHDGTSKILGVLVKILSRKKKVVFTQHFIRTRRQNRNALVRALLTLVHSVADLGVDRAIAVSESVATAVRLHEFVLKKKLTLIYNAIPEVDPAQLKDAVLLRQELGISLQARVIICVARLEKEKDLEFLVSALSLLESSAVCLLVGEGSLREQIENSLRKTKLIPSVQLLGYREDVLSLIRLSDLLILPSHQEPFGLCLIEAMSLRKPVIAAAAGGPAEIVLPNETGLLFKPGDQVALAEALTKLLEKVDLAKTFGEKGYLRFQNLFSVETMMAKICEVYNHVSA